MVETGEYLDVAREAAFAAGRRVMEVLRSTVEVARKEDRSLVTNADHEANTLILEALRRSFPEHGILSEETGREGPFNLVLADPPYDRSGTARWLEKTLIGLEGRSMFPAPVLLVFELSSGEDVVERPGWSLIKDKRYGETRLLTYEKGSDLSRDV